jgi:hypothetical protein
MGIGCGPNAGRDGGGFGLHLTPPVNNNLVTSKLLPWAKPVIELHFDAGLGNPARHPEYWGALMKKMENLHKNLDPGAAVDNLKGNLGIG